MALAQENAVNAVRGFNRFYTKQIGVLRESLLDTPYSLTQARILYELAHQQGVSSKQLGDTLSLDPGYLSRQIAKFQKARLLSRKTSPDDARVHHLSLTRKGRAAFDTLNQRAASEVEDQLNLLPPTAQAKLVKSMRCIQSLLEPTAKLATVQMRAPQPGDMGWVVARQGAVYAREYAWDATYEALVAEIVAKFIRNLKPDRERCWIAEAGGLPAGSVFLVEESRTVARLRLLFVEPSARGLGVGGRLVEECISFARAARYRKIRLWTNDILHAARRIYQRAGFVLVEEKPHHSFGHDLVGQTWDLTL